MPVIRPEEDLLLCCARQPSSIVAAQLREIVSRGVDWTVVRRLAHRHRLIPLVYRHLRTAAPRLLDEPDLKELAQDVLRIAARNLRFTGELLVLLELLREHGIPAIPFKGPLLAVLAFGDLSLRDFGDLDLLLRPADIPKARRLLEIRGYRPEMRMAGAKEAAYVRAEHAFQYVRDDVIVELHWRLQDRNLKFPFDADDLWGSAYSVQLFGTAVTSLSPEMLFLYLCWHGAKHYWERLEWLACLPAVIGAFPGMNWALVLAKARSLRGLRILHLGLLLADKLDPSEATRSVLSNMQNDSVAEALSTSVWTTLFSDVLEGSGRAIYQFRFYISARENLWDRINILRTTTIRIPQPKSPVFDRIRLPDWLLFLHWILGPLRLFRKYGLEELAGIVNPKRASLQSPVINSPSSLSRTLRVKYQSSAARSVPTLTLTPEDAAKDCIDIQ